MLQTISWGEYLITIGLGLGFYYGWWLVRYYSGMRRQGKAGGSADKDRSGDG
jgi:hypothetical protein